MVLLFCLLLVCVGGASAAVTEAEAQGTNAAPVAKDNEHRVKKDGTLRISAPGVLRNDLDPDGDQLSARRQSSPRHGRLTLRSGGSFVYTPDKGYRGKDSFVYEAADATGGTDTATVEITVWSPNRLPLARNNAYGVEEDATLTVPAAGVLKNDAEAAGRRLFATKVTDPGNGSLSLNRDGSFVYTPDADFDGEDSFVYRARDNRGRDGQGTVRITVGAVNDAPVFTGAAGNTSQTIDEGAELAALEAADADGDTLTFELTGGSLPPGITLDSGGRFAGVAGGRAAGNYTADIKVSDGDGESATTQLAITVNGVEETAVASDADVTTDEDVAKTITLSATDADTDNLTFSVGSPGHGSLGAPSAPDCNTSAGTATCTTTVLYTPDADFNGPDSFTYTAGDSASATVRIAVNAVNDKPVAEADSKTTPENTPLVFPASDLVANDSKGAANENAQTLTVTEVTNPQNGTVVLDSGEITFTPQADYSGAAGFDYTVCDSGQACSTQTAAVNVTVSPVNSGPTASAIPESLDIDEDAAAQTVTLAGADTETGAANLRFKITEAPTHGVLEKGATALGTDDGFTGSPTDVTYEPDADYNGPDSFRFEVIDRGDPDNCGAPAPACAAPKSDAETVPITVNSVVDLAKITTSAGTVSYTENDEPTSIDNGLGLTHPEGVRISRAEVRITTNHQGGEDALAFGDNDPGDNITLDPASAGATLTLRGTDSAANYQAALRAVTYENTSEAPSGLTRTVRFTATDANSVASSPATRDIAVVPVEDLPVAVDDSATVEEDASATSVSVLDNDTDVDGGAKTLSAASDPANGTVVLTGGSPGAHTGLTYQPDANYCNDPPATTPDTFTYTLNGGSTGTVSMTVTCVNDAPVADNETFDGNNSAVGNTTFIGNDPSDGAPSASGPKKTITGDVLTGDTDVDGPGPLEVAAGTFATNDGGSVTIESDGDFTYVNDPADSCADTSDSFDYTVTDKNVGTAGTDTGRVNVSIAGCVWYVDNSASGNSGTSTAPFDTLAQAETASGNNHTVFVFDGDGSSTGLDAGGYAMNSGEHLVGEHTGLVVDPDRAGALNADTLHPANPGAHPTLTANNVDVIDLDDGNEIRGLAVDPQGTGGGIFGGAGDVGGTFDDVNVTDGGTAGGQAGLELNGTTGTFTFTDLAIDNKATGVLLNNPGTTDFGSTTITSDGGPGLSATGANMSTSSFDQITVTNSGTGSVVLTNLTGATNFGDGIGTDLDLTTTSGATAAFKADNVTGLGVGSNGTDDVNATGGPAVDVVAAPGAVLDFDHLRSTNSSTDGVNLDGLGTGTFGASSTSVISGAAGIAFDLNGGSGAVSYPGSLNNGTGGTAEITNRTGGAATFVGAVNDNNDSGGGISLTGNTGGSTTFSNATKTLNTGSSDAIVFNNSDGHTLTLSGGSLDIDTTSGKGLEATNSGTLNITGSVNTINTTTGPALNASNTDIGSNGLVFQSISAGTGSSGPANGIVLNSTGSSGGLTVQGNGGTCNSRSATCTGGTIQRTGGDGISLNSTLSPSFAQMKILDTGHHGVQGTEVTNFGFTNGAIDNSGTASGVDDSNIAFNKSATLRENNVDGTVTITGNTLSNPHYHGVDIFNWDGVLANANVSNNTITAKSGGPRSLGSAIRLIARGESATSASVTRANLDNNTVRNGWQAVGIQAQGGNVSAPSSVRFGVAGSATDVISISGNTLSATAAEPFNVEGILAVHNHAGQANFRINNNGTAATPIGNTTGTAISNSAFGNVTVTSEVKGNHLAPNNTFASQGIGVGTSSSILPTNGGNAQTPDFTVAIESNTITQTDGAGILAVANDATSLLKIAIKNNDVAGPLSSGRQGIVVRAGNSNGDNDVCLDISGNKSAAPPSAPAFLGIGLRKQGTSPTVNAFGIEGMSATSSPGVESYVDGKNPSGGGTLLVSATSGFTNCSSAP